MQHPSLYLLSAINKSGFYLLLLVSLLSAGAAFSQQTATVSGIVTAPDGSLLSGVSVKVKGYPFCASTDDQGRYRIKFPADDSPGLLFSFTGMETEEMAIDEKHHLNVVMKGIEFSPESFHILRDFHPNKFLYRESGLKGMRDCHFTVADVSDSQDYALCEKLGLAVIVTETPHLTGPEWEKLSDAEIDKKVRRMIEKGGNSKAIIGYQLCDEPSATAFPALGKAVAAVKKYAPGKFAYINLYPNYATLWTMDKVKSQLGTRTYMEYLERFVKEVKPQLISYDNYMVQFSMDLEKESQAAKYYTNLMEVRQVALKNDLPFYNIVSSNQIRPHTTIPSPANLSFQAYTTLAAGARGVKWYTYHGNAYDYNPQDKRGNKTLTWRYLEEVNRQISILGPVMSKLTSTGVYFTSPTPDESLPLLPGKWVKNIETTSPMMLGEFVSDDGTNYAMIVNLSLEKSAKFIIETKIPREKMFIVSAAEQGQLVEADDQNEFFLTGHGKERKPGNEKRGIWLTAGQGVLLKLGGKTAEEN
jgi:hypothetical protein